MKLIFLDIDGVLNHTEWMQKVFGNAEDKRLWVEKIQDFDPECIKGINDLVARSGAKIVISSSWRHGRTVDDLRQILCTRNKLCAEIIGMTPTFTDDTIRALEKGKGHHRRDRLFKQEATRWGTPICRGDEIWAWMNLCEQPIDNFVIIDDDADMSYLSTHLVQITGDTGFRDWHMWDALKRLHS